MQIIKQFGIAVLIFIWCVNSINGQGLNNFDRGFQSGFKQGYCYNQNLGCVVPQIPIAPMPRVGESQNNYTDGFNRGFQVALDMQRVNSASLNSNRYNENNKPISSFRTSEYVAPVDLNLLKDVVQYKQRIFDSRSKWIQSRINDITDLNYSLLFEKDRNMYSNIDKQIQEYVAKQLNESKPNVSDNNIFSQIETSLQYFQSSIVNSYNSTLSTNINNSTQRNPIADNNSNPCTVSLSWKNIGNYQCYNKDLNGNILAGDLTISVLPFDKEKIVIAYSHKFNSTYAVSLDVNSDSYTGPGKIFTLNLICKTASIRLYGKNITPIFFYKGERQENVQFLGEVSLQFEGTNNSVAFKSFEDSKTNKKFLVNSEGYKEGLLEPIFHIDGVWQIDAQ